MPDRISAIAWVPAVIRSPTSNEVRAAREKAGLTQAQSAAKVRSTTKTWDRWESQSEKQQREMHPGLFELFLIKTGQPVPEWLRS